MLFRPAGILCSSPYLVMTNPTFADTYIPCTLVLTLVVSAIQMLNFRPLFNSKLQSTNHFSFTTIKMIMVRTPIILTVWFLIMTTSSGETREVREALVRFMTHLAPSNNSILSGWNTTSDPCHHLWTGVVCDGPTSTVTEITLDGLNLTGTIDANSLCLATSLFSLTLSSNSLVGEVPAEISKCTNLLLLDLHHNFLTGDLPPSLVQLSWMIKLDISNNGFTGELPELSEFTVLVYFHAEQNELSGEIPELSRNGLLVDLNVSDNNLSGRIPDDGWRFDASSFSGNPGLCGPPLLKLCPPAVDGTSSSATTLLQPFYFFSNMLLLISISMFLFLFLSF